MAHEWKVLISNCFLGTIHLDQIWTNQFDQVLTRYLDKIKISTHHFGIHFDCFDAANEGEWFVRRLRSDQRRRTRRASQIRRRQTTATPEASRSLTTGRLYRLKNIEICSFTNLFSFQRKNKLVNFVNFLNFTPKRR